MIRTRRKGDDQRDLGPELEAYVSQRVESGRYNSKCEGVRVIQEHEARLAALDASIARGIADAESGRTKSAAEVFDRLEAKYAAMSRDQE
ncbi:type II toxin-antitoxin system ParD family antitoxin [Sphingomonas sp. OTU376]|uniref:type II toxin-antitoxin system ParD family antitoxin n=1 Tax=Sphingomonas sp. OTU376 TaxID=3043863 RepID=UPI00313B0682